MQHASSVLAIMGGFLCEDKKIPGYFRTCNVDDNDYGIDRGDLRVYATAVEYCMSKDPKPTIIALGGLTPLHRTMPDAPHLSSVIKGELTSYTVPPNHIEEVVVDPEWGTHRQLVHLGLAVANQSGIRRVTIISEKWHCERINTMLVFSPKLDPLHGIQPLVEVHSAESILLEHAPEHWHSKLLARYQSNCMADIKQREGRGTLTVADGTYQYPPVMTAEFVHQTK